MTDREKFEQCWKLASSRVQEYRCEAPKNCDPKAWYISTTLIVLALVSAAVSAYGAQSSAQAQSDAANYNAAVAKNNAGAAFQQSIFDSQQIADKNRRTLAAQRAAYAANGVATDSGSPTDVAADSAQQGEMQRLMAIYTGRSTATAQEAQSRLDSLQAANARTAGYIGTGASIIGGVSSAAYMDANSKNPTFIR